MILIAVGAYCVFARPCVRLGGEYLVVRNPFRTHVFSLGDPTGISIRAVAFYPVLEARGRKISLFGLEDDLVREAFGSKNLHSLAERIAEASATDPHTPARPVVTRLHLVDVGLVVTLLPWVLYVLASILFGKLC